jgi:SAM-dependent methyltransferase
VSPLTPGVYGPSVRSDDVTLATYDARAEVYVAHSRPPVPAVAAYLDELARRVGTGTVLELGSGPGLDAAHLESRGPRVLRTDGAPAFVAMLEAAGHSARLLDVRTDDLGGPYDAVLADAVLLHLTREELADVLVRARRAVRPGGWLAVTLKEGDGEAWTTAKLGLPRFYTYWREPELRTALEATGWDVVTLDPVDGRLEPWLFVLARVADL